MEQFKWLNINYEITWTSTATLPVPSVWARWRGRLRRRWFRLRSRPCSRSSDRSSQSDLNYKLLIWVVIRFVLVIRTKNNEFISYSGSFTVRNWNLLCWCSGVRQPGECRRRQACQGRCRRARWPPWRTPLGRDDPPGWRWWFGCRNDEPFCLEMIFWRKFWKECKIVTIQNNRWLRRTLCLTLNRRSTLNQGIYLFHRVLINHHNKQIHM